MKKTTQIIEDIDGNVYRTHRGGEAVAGGKMKEERFAALPACFRGKTGFHSWTYHHFLEQYAI